MKTTFAFIAMGLIVLLASCEQTSQVVDPPKTAALSGDRIDGQVQLIDAHGNPVVDRAGVVVTATNTSGTAYVDTTDASGDFHIENAAAGVYSITAVHPEYDPLSGRSMSTLRNVQYVGSGVYQIGKLWLAKDPSLSIVSDLSADLEWTFTRDPHDTNVIRSTHCSVMISMNWQNTDGSVAPEVYISDAPDSDCENALFRVRAVSKVSRTGTLTTYSLGRAYDDLKAIYPDDLHERTVYIQVRPQVLRRDSVDGPARYECGPITAVPVTFTTD